MLHGVVGADSHDLLFSYFQTTKRGLRLVIFRTVPITPRKSGIWTEVFSAEVQFGGACFSRAHQTVWVCDENCDRENHKGGRPLCPGGWERQRAGGSAFSEQPTRGNAVRRGWSALRFTGETGHTSGTFGVKAEGTRYQGRAK